MRKYIQRPLGDTDIESCAWEIKVPMMDSAYWYGANDVE